MEYFIDSACNFLNKRSEELCGDMVKTISDEDKFIAVFSDGMGSGVRANILATLTCTIGTTMLKEGADIEETVETIADTLPVSKITNMAYSTFTILNINGDGRIKVFEYDNPAFFLVRNGEIIKPYKNIKEVCGKSINIYDFHIELDDVITIISDGVIGAGKDIGLNLGWQWNDVADYLTRMSLREKCAEEISKDLSDVCSALYENDVKDDATVFAIKIRKKEIVNILTGPPKDKNSDSSVIKSFMNMKGKKVICGGTTANIVARELKKDIDIISDTVCDGIPPISCIEGIDLVTEGVLTLKETVKKINAYLNNSLDEKRSEVFRGIDGASRLSKMLVENCTNVNFLIGRAVNEAYSKGFPFSECERIRVLNELNFVMKKMGKTVSVKYL